VVHNNEVNNLGKHFALNREKHKRGEEFNALSKKTIPKELFHYLPQLLL
jgi:hypothetical protein